MRVMTARKYYDKMEKETGKKEVLRKSSASLRSTHNTISAKPIKYNGPQAGAFLQRFHNIKTRYESEVV